MKIEKVFFRRVPLPLQKVPQISSPSREVMTTTEVIWGLSEQACHCCAVGYFKINNRLFAQEFCFVNKGVLTFNMSLIIISLAR